MLPPATCPMLLRRLALVSACALSGACATTPPAAGPVGHPPAELFARADRPEPGPDALTSDAAYERWVSALDAWGRDNARRLDAACRWWREAASERARDLACRPASVSEQQR